jgi:hypothetical protein
LYDKTGRTVWAYQSQAGGVLYYGLDKDTKPPTTHPRSKDHTLYGYINFSSGTVVRSVGSTKAISTTDWHKVGRAVLTAVLTVAKLVMLAIGLAVVVIVAILSTTNSRRS